MNKNGIAIVLGVLIVGGVYFGMQTRSEESVIHEHEHEHGVEASHAEHGFKGLISPITFQEKMESGEYTIVDVRTPEEYTEQRIGVEALSVNFYDTDFTEQLATLDTSKKYLVHCKSGGRSSKAVQVMEELGFEEFYELTGGIDNWNREGLQTY